jgi:hypothetical protein
MLLQVPEGGVGPPARAPRRVQAAREAPARAGHQAVAYDDINNVITGPVLQIDASTMLRRRKHALMNLYASALDIVTLAASLALETATGLQHIVHGSTLGPKAFSLAIQLDELLGGLERLERGRGVLWSQVLYIRNPQREHAPSKLAAKICDLVQIAALSERFVHKARILDLLALCDYNSEYVQHHQLQDVIREI